MLNINAVWAWLIVEELTRCGVFTFFISPGSRSTPLTAAIARHPDTQTIVHFDERGAAFAAIGYGRARRSPAAWVTTSGTAVANGLPAVIEASIDTVPLLLLTADRPPELRRTGANQTIRQPGIFGDYLRWKTDGPPPTTDIPASFVLTTVDQAVHRTTQGAGGPVHLNWMFREPLAPVKDGMNETTYLNPVNAWRSCKLPFTAYTSSRQIQDNNAVQALTEQLSQCERGVLVAGRIARAGDAKAVADLAAAWGWPLLADIGSQLRIGTGPANRISFYDSLLVQPVPEVLSAPDAVLHFGRRCTSKRLYQWIEASSPSAYAVIDTIPERFDPSHQVTHRAEADIASFCAMLNNVSVRSNETWLRGWQQYDQEAGKVLGNRFQDEAALTEPLVARLISEMLNPDGVLFIANSMPVRDMDAYATATGPFVPIALNRGASGIDGTIATAAGFALGHRKRATLLIGDLSLLHDLNSLALLRALPEPLIVVVINNNGGGIFSFLPIASHSDVFETFFGTPHNLQFQHAARLFELQYYAPSTRDTFIDVYRQAMDSSKSAIIEVNTDRRTNRAVHKHIESEIREAISREKK